MRQIPIHRSLNRKILLLGGEKSLVELLAFFCILLGLGGMTKVSVILAVIFWFSGTPILQKMAKHDPYLSGIFLKYIKQQNYYLARATAFRRI